jgi:hypothetical protein
MMYYRIAIQTRNESNLKWKSTKLTSLGAVFQLLRRYSAMPQDRVRVLMASSRDEMDKQLLQQNNGLGSHSVTAVQFLQERLISSQEGTSHAVAPRPYSNESNRESHTQEKRALSSLERKQVEPEHRVHRGDFWNVMALVVA